MATETLSLSYSLHTFMIIYSIISISLYYYTVLKTRLVVFSVDRFSLMDGPMDHLFHSVWIII